MRILALVTDAFGGHGGIAKFNRDLLNSLCLYSQCEKIVAIPRIMLVREVQIPSNLEHVTSGLGSKINYVKTICRLLLKRKKYEIIICAHINLIPIAYIINIFNRSTLVLIIHGIDAWQPPKSIFSKYLTRKINYFISVSQFTASRFREWSKLPKNMQFILPNCVDFKQFSPGRKSNKLSRQYGLNNRVVLMTLGRLVSFDRKKGFDEVIELLPDLINEIPNIIYLIVGDGPDKQRLINKAQKLGVLDYVIFAGYINEIDKTEYYRLADVFVMPSKGEGFGIVLLEAMACGVPTVASKKDGGQEALCNGELGLLVDPDNPEEIKTAILKALKMPKEAPAGLKQFSFENFSKRLHDIIESILKNM